jgi:hypothetical protein
MWLEDEGYLVNEEQEELVEKSKQNKIKPWQKVWFCDTIGVTSREVTPQGKKT